MRHREPAPAGDGARRSEAIAVVGIGCRLPGGVDSSEAYWHLLMEGVDAICDVPDERWNHAAFYHPDPEMPRKTVAAQGGFLRGIDAFDPGFFGISPREAEQMDPQHRLLLEVGWEALEDAGIPLEAASAVPTGVFMGISAREYPLFQTTDTVGTHTTTGQAAAMAANRLSYAFNLTGPSVALDTACSSSLVAVHMACRSIWDGESELALAGGVNLNLSPDAFVGFSNLSMLSPDSRCFAFDARANGYVRSEGAGVLVLKPLSRALEDGDRIYARILATAVNQDGRTQGITVPGQPAQERMLSEAYARGGVAPADVSYVEAHGTGTQVGDFIEASAIGAILGRADGRLEPLLLGSAKTNVGHLESAAGVAGLVKACLVARHRIVPPNLHFETPNPRIDFEGLGLRVPTEPTPLGGGDGAAIGVNSFGFGGTNAHVVLAPPPSLEPAPGAAGTERPDPDINCLPLSARSPEALTALAGRMVEFLEGVGEGEPALGDVCFTAGARRTHHEFRLVALGEDVEALGSALRARLDDEESPKLVSGRVSVAGKGARVAFVFPGQGSQWRGMARELLAGDPVFRQVVARCDAVVRAEARWSLLDEFAADEGGSRLGETAVTQPMLFAVQAGLLAALRARGVEPDAVVGHSVGEIASAYAAGVMELEEAARVAVHRGRLMDRATARGRMLAVGASADRVLPFLEGCEDRVSLAAVNSPTSLTLSGEGEALERVRRALRRERIAGAFLDVEYAFHSPQMEPIRDELMAELSELRPRPAGLPLVSTVTGTRSPGREWDAAYWWRNLREPVRFADAIGALASDGVDVFVELGPQPTLVGAIRDTLHEVGVEAKVLSPLRRTGGDVRALAETVAQLHVTGVPVRWERLHTGARPVSLPRYPWQRERHWIESPRRRHEMASAPVHRLLGVAQPTARPTWLSRIDLVSHSELADHVFQGAAVLPAAGYLEMGLAVAALQGDSRVLEVEAVTFDAPCFLSADRDTLLETRFDVNESRFEIFGRSEAEEGWTMHASGRVVVAASSQVVDATGIDEVRARLSHELRPDDLYGRFSELGLEYGAAFQGIVGALRGQGEVLAEVALPPLFDAASADDHHLHPSLLDACLQATLACLPDDGGAPSGASAFLPVGADRLRVFRRHTARGLCHVRLTGFTGDEIRADVRLLDDEERLVAELRGLTCRAVARSAGAAGVDRLLYRSRWVPEALEADDAEPGALLLVGGGPAFSSALAELVREAGHSVAVVDGAHEVAGALGRLRSEGVPGTVHVVHAATLEVPSSPATVAEMGLDGARSLVPLLELVQGLTADGEPSPPPLTVVTRRAHSPGDPESARVEPAQAPAWGLRRVAAFEHPALRSRSVDLGDPTSEHELRGLVREVLGGSDDDEVLLRGEARFVHRYLGTSAGELAPDEVRSVAPAEVAFRATSDRLGMVDNLHFRALSPTPPGPGEVEIEVRAAGVNFADVLKSLGLYPGVTAATATFGAECAGVVTALGPPRADAPSPNGRGGLRVGQRVVALAADAFGSRVTTPDAYVFPIADEMGFDEAAALPIVFLTAHYGLVELGRVRSGERVLIHSATGGVGQAAVQIARARGAEIFATAGSEEKRDFLRGQGIEHVFDSRSLGFADGVLAATGGEGVDVVLNSLPGEAIRKGLSILRPFGRFIEIGKRDVHGDARLGLRPLKDNITFAVLDLDQAMRERPALVHDLFAEVMACFARGSYRPVPVRSFPAPEMIDAFRFMSKARHMGKVAVSFQVPSVDVAFSRRMPRLRSDGTYLVTGGLGGFGSTVARWLASKGAGHLVLVGRRGEQTPGAAALADELRGLGASVTIAAVDVTDAAALAALLGEVRASHPPIRGVVHAAMVLDDGVIRRLDARRLARVMEPKAVGAWHLHRETLDDPLDLFVMTSSVSAILGSPGQANYAAANAFLDALAHLRVAEGRPGLSVNLGALGAVGHASRHPELLAYLSTMGIPPVDPDDALAAMEVVLASGVPQVGVVEFDFQRLGTGLTGTLLPRRFRDLVASDGGGRGGPDGQALRRAVEAAEPEDRQTLVLDALVEELSRVLGIEPERLDTRRHLSELGIDSLMTVELVVWVEQSLDLKIPTVELMRDPSTAQLAGLLVAMLDAEAAAHAEVDQGASVDLVQEARLDADVAPRSPEEPAELPERVLLTGATGFVGAHLLVELLARTDATVHCLVRADDEASARERIRGAVARYSDVAALDAERVVAVPGDLGEPRLGLSPEVWTDLAATLDAVVHSGAVVNFLSAYEAVRRTNVEGTRQILELVAEGRAKRLHHVSSIAVFGPEYFGGSISEDTIPREVGGLPDGYSQSKWVAEQLVFAAARQGLDVRVYRPGLLTGDSRTGVVSLNDAVLQLLLASCTVGALPDLALRVDTLPVDVAAASLVEILRSGRRERIYHLCNPEPTPLAEITAHLREWGLDLDVLSFAAWRETMIAHAGTHRFEPLVALIPETEEEAVERLGGMTRRFEVEHTRRAIEGSDVVLEPLGQEGVRRLLGHLAREGLLPEPQVASGAAGGGPATG